MHVRSLPGGCYEAAESMYRSPLAHNAGAARQGASGIYENPSKTTVGREIFVPSRHVHVANG
jgi:hypothetical protein